MATPVPKASSSAAIAVFMKMTPLLFADQLAKDRHVPWDRGRPDITGTDVQQQNNSNTGPSRCGCGS